MCLRYYRLLTLSSSVFLLSLIAGVAANQATGQAPVKSALPPADGLVRTEVSLAAHTVTVAFAPALKATDLTKLPVPVGHLVTTGTLRIGSVTIGKLDRAGIRYDLALEEAGSGWQLLATDAAKAVAQIPLSHRASSVDSPNLVVALVPENMHAARLILRWGEHEATADVHFTDPLRPVRPPASRVLTNRAHDADMSALYRANLLNLGNETAFVLAKGQRLSIFFQRTYAKGEEPPSFGGSAPKGLPFDGRDFAGLAKTPDGAVVVLSNGIIPRLKTQVPLRFGKTLIAADNQAPGFPGMYGIWLKRVGSGWRLVVTDQPDVWGTQHDAKFDLAEIDVTHTEGHLASRPFAVGLEPTAADRGRLVVIWGPHEWAADVVMGG